MKSASQKIILVVVGAIIFNCIFWQEKLALNAILFAAFILPALFYLYRKAFINPIMKWLVLANCITLATVLIHNTVLSKIAFNITLLLVVVFAQFIHRSVWYAGGSAVINYISMPYSLLSNIRSARYGNVPTKGLSKKIRFLIIPLLLSFVFFILYNLANSVFQDFINRLGIIFERFFDRFLAWFNWERLGFLLLGVFITGGLLLKSNINYFSEKDISKTNDLERKRTDLKLWKASHWFALLSIVMGKFANGVMALKNEQITGIISLALLNLLLLVINCIDIQYVWFGVTYKANVNYSEAVHEGAGILIFSIVLAMCLLLFFFRGNLNFYTKNKWLRYGAYAWLIQNSILVISVLFRDYYYIANMGLAYKRIGVLVFLLLVLVGLITVFIKIQQRKTNYYLLRVNAWFAITVLVVSSCFHWDEIIANYNFARKDKLYLDVKFLLSLSDKTLPLLEKNINELESKDTTRYGSEGQYLYRSNLGVKEKVEERRKEFFKEQQQYSWLSWNMADEYVKKHLSNVAVVSPTK